MIVSTVHFIALSAIAGLATMVRFNHCRALNVLNITVSSLPQSDHVSRLFWIASVVPASEPILVFM